MSLYPYNTRDSSRGPTCIFTWPLYLQEAERTKTNLFSDKKWNQDRVLMYAGQKQAVGLG